MLRDVAPIEATLRELWGDDLDHVIDIMDGECDPSQVRYGACGGKANKRNRVIPSGYAEIPDVWTSTTLVLYEELMSSLGRAIWSNHPEGDRNGKPVTRKFELLPANMTPQGLAEMPHEQQIALQKLQFDPTIWAFLLSAASAEGTARAPYWGIIPMDRLNDPDGTKFYVRARISPNMVADVEVTKEAHGVSVGSCRLTGREDGEYGLTIHTGLAAMPNRGGSA